jgi:pyruvate dehydrogenase E1 component
MISASDLAILRSIETKLVWLATWMVHHANHVRPNADGTKVGGHQASSTSIASLMTHLYFRSLGPGDLIGVKPHAAPLFYAIQYLRGKLAVDDLRELRSYRRLQAYPSRRGNPDLVDLSMGSMGLGAVQATFGALTRRYLLDHVGTATPERFVVMLGDAELDEGNVWEALLEETVARLGGLLWIVDVNRQSLDRVIPDARLRQFPAMFAALGWHVVELRWGTRLSAVFARRGGRGLRRRLEEMSAAEYHRLLRQPPPALRKALVTRDDDVDASLDRLLANVADDELASLVGNVGGHDLEAIDAAMEEAGTHADRPCVILAHTVKGYRLPLAADPLNHTALLGPTQIEACRASLGVEPGEEWAGFADDSAEAAFIRGSRLLFTPTFSVAAAAPRSEPGEAPDERTPEAYSEYAAGRAEEGNDAMRRSSAGVDESGDRGAPRRRRGARSAGGLGGFESPPMISVPERIGEVFEGLVSTQEAFGRVLGALSRMPVADAVVTVSADVAVTTHLAGWINRKGIYFPEARANPFGDTPQAVAWRESPAGQHIELGIAEHNLFLLLGALGLAHELSGVTLLPIGTLYDPFVQRGLDALYHALYSGARFVVAATPSGVSLSPEGGAHQSVITPGIGVALPHLTYLEPVFGAEVEWILLEALRGIADRTGESAYLRLSTRPVDQRLAPPPSETWRAEALRGAYRLVDGRHADGWDPDDAVQLFAAGVMVPEAVAAAGALRRHGVHASVFAVTSPDLLYRGLRAPRPWLEQLVGPDEEDVPIVSVLDGHSHGLAFLGSALGVPQVALGVDDFGQSGARADLYRHYGIDAPAIVSAARTLLAR